MPSTLRTDEICRDTTNRKPASQTSHNDGDYKACGMSKCNKSRAIRLAYVFHFAQWCQLLEILLCIAICDLQAQRA